MRFGSLFTGVGGFDLGFERAGMECVWQAERDKFALQVLEGHWPNVKRYEDVRDVGKGTEPVELICGGFPCQDLSVAGKRAGLAGERSGLFFEFARIIGDLRPRWVVIENVPGLLSSAKGKDMDVLCSTLAELGYWWAYRVLDSQYFGVAQRRRRVFIVANSTDPTAPAKVLFEPESGDRDSAPSREARKASPPLTATGVGAGRTGNERNELDFCIPDVARSTTGEGLRQKADQDNYLPVAFHPRRTELNALEDLSPTQNTGGGDTAKALKANASKSYQGVGVRRLTPMECERLQGFPDGWTEGQSDTQRYKMMGNAVTVNVIEWIGKRIMDVR